MQSRLQRFRVVELSDDLQQAFGLPERICADPDGLPFVEGQAFRTWLIEENACQAVTADHYLRVVLKFLTFLWFGSPPVLYTAPAEQIRQRAREYLCNELGCRVRPHRNGNVVVLASKQVTQETVRLYLVALKRFYACALLKGWYSGANPFAWSGPLAHLDPEGPPQMPLTVGMTLPFGRQGRMPETYFCVSGAEWRPHVIDDPGLPKRLVAACTTRRDQIIMRMLFESGARIGEILGLTVGDWRRYDWGERAWATNKGSHGERVKEIWWSSTTSRLLHRYVHEERCEPDGRSQALEALPEMAPLFVTRAGAAYTYPAFYYHWQSACQAAAVQVHPHQARHWFVTLALHSIQALPDPDRRDGARRGLITYMGWRNPETLKAYDHHLQLRDFAATHAALAQLVQDGAGRASVSSHTAVAPWPEGMAISAATWERLDQLLGAD
ncbi:MAG: site-specific integrase [Anaerolineales bacterium]|nr:site-specific integrase [Anaerolineales bacterium]